MLSQICKLDRYRVMKKVFTLTKMTILLKDLCISYRKVLYEPI